MIGPLPFPTVSDVHKLCFFQNELVRIVNKYIADGFIGDGFQINVFVKLSHTIMFADDINIVNGLGFETNSHFIRKTS